MIDHRLPAGGRRVSRDVWFGEETSSLLSPKPLHDELVVESVLFWIKSPLRTRFFVVCAAIFGNMFLYGLFIGLAPYYRTSLSLTELELGSLFSAFCIVPLFIIPALGLCVNETPQRLFFGLGGLLCALSSLAMVTHDDSYTGVLFSRLLHGFGATVVWLTGPGLIHEIFGLPSGTKAMGVVYIFAEAAFLGGTVMGSNSLDWTGSTVPIYSATLFMNVCTTVFVLATLPPHEKSAMEIFAALSRRTVREGWDEYMSLLKHRSVLLLLMNVAVFAVATTVVQTFIPSWVQYRLGISVSGAADVYAVLAVAKLASQPSFGRLTLRYNPHSISAAGMIGYGLLLPLMPLASFEMVLDVVLFALVGIAMTATLLPTLISLSDIVDGGIPLPEESQRRYALANSLWLLMFMFGGTIAPVAVGAIFDSFPTATTSEDAMQQHMMVLGCLGAVMALVQGPLYLVLTSKEHQDEMQEGEEENSKQYC